MNDFEKIADHPKWQVYKVISKDINLKLPFKWVYKDINGSDLTAVETDTTCWDYKIFSKYTGFVFCKKDAVVPNIGEFVFEKDNRIIKAENLNKYLLDTPDQIALKVIPRINASPKFTKEIIYTFTEDKYDKLESKKLLDSIINCQTNKTSKDWYENIRKCCPDIHYQKNISKSSFDYNIKKNDLEIHYMFRTQNEFKHLIKLEEMFINFNQNIKVYDDFTNKYKLALNYCTTKKIRHKTGMIYGINYIEMKYSDFIKIPTIELIVSQLLC
jgi:hypothetical protein